MNPARRSLLSGALGLSAAGALGALRARAGESGAARTQPKDARARRLALKSLHTDESLEVEYWCDGAYVPAALDALEHLLRDFRNDARHPIDPRLFDILSEVATRLEVEPEFAVISGYRSPVTNAMLHERSSGVAARSLHLEGRAIDVRLARTDCAALANMGLALARGGVGYYRRSDFVHLDTGRVRTWRG